MSSKLLGGFMRKKPRPGYEKGDPDKMFELLECLGEGTYGTVWTGTEKKTGRTCAVKIVTIDDDLEEIEQEIAIMRDSDSPYIVKFYGAYWADKKKIWMVMEHCIAGSLNDLMYVCDITLNADQIRTAAAAMTMGLRYLHKSLVIHRDIKAGNVLLTAEGHIRLADFGVSAKLKKPSDRTNTAIGAPFWMAPEVINESPYDGRADVWSLGITLIELAEGRPPNSHINPMKALFIIPQQQPPTLAEPDKWPKDMIEFVKACLIKDPKKRQKSEKMVKMPFIAKEAQAIETNDGKSVIMRKLVKKSLKKIEKWRNEDGEDDSDDDGVKPAKGAADDNDDQTEDKEDEEEEVEINLAPVATPSNANNGMSARTQSPIQVVPSPARASVKSNRPKSAISQGAESEASQEMFSPAEIKKVKAQEEQKQNATATAKTGIRGKVVSSPHPPPSNRSSLHLNAIRDGKIRESVRHSSARRVEPLRDVVEPKDQSFDGDGKRQTAYSSFMKKGDQKDLSMEDVANIMNSDLPAHSNQVQAAVMTKEFIVLLKSIYRNDPKAFGGKALKNWTGEDITVAVVKALHSVLGESSPSGNNYGASYKEEKANAGSKGNKKVNMDLSKEDEFDYEQFEQDEKDLKRFMNPIEFDPERDGEMPPPPPLDSDGESDIEI